MSVFVLCEREREILKKAFKGVIQPISKVFNVKIQF